MAQLAGDQQPVGARRRGVLGVVGDLLLGLGDESRCLVVIASPGREDGEVEERLTDVGGPVESAVDELPHLLHQLVPPSPAQQLAGEVADAHRHDDRVAQAAAEGDGLFDDGGGRLVVPAQDLAVDGDDDARAGRGRPPRERAPPWPS